jgi:hypothetical protein
MPRQRGWNFCKNCGAMTFSRNPGQCVAGGPHQPQGFNFVLPHDISLKPSTQQGWRRCLKCEGLHFFPGAPKPCVAGGDHEPSEFNYVLTHDTAEIPNTQRKWFYCAHCSLMTFGPVIGRCVADAQGITLGHDGSRSFEFVLPFKP